MAKTAKNKRVAKGCAVSFLAVTAVFIVIILLAGLIGGLIIFSTVPSLEELTPSSIAETSKVYALDGSLLTEFHAEENREIIPFSKMSENIKNAVIAVEDKRYYEHQGVDYRRIIGAFLADIRSGSLGQGASTITMQYIKNVYFTPEKTFRRKINEAVIAIQLERNYTKDKILEMYLNTIYFGAGNYGIEKAAQSYFGVSAAELDLAQSALLAGLIRSPENYNPFNNIEMARGRRNLVLKLMNEQGYINNKEYLKFLTEPIVLNKNQGQGSQIVQDRFAPYFIDYVKQQLYEKKFTDYDVFKGGLRIYTTLDISLQKKAEEAVNKVFPTDPGPSYALVSVDPSNGYIYALIGGKDYNESKFNAATQGKRQPGSVFKTLVLMESIRQNLSPNDTYNPNGPIVIDLPSGPDWKVENYGGKNYETDKMTIIDATINSVNVVYAQLMMKIGAENVEKLCTEMGIEDIGSNPAIALGGLENGITPIDVTKIFSTLSADGYYREPVCITKITDSAGNILYEYDEDKNENNKRILESPIALFATSILEKVITDGTGKAANIGRPAAGKTGTTSDYRDAWFGGYTPELATVVWMGFLESNKPMDRINDRSVTGGSFPADIWREYMSAALKDRPVRDFGAADSGLIDVEVCTESGLLPTFWCPKEKLGFRIFVKGQEPTQVCNIHNKVQMPDIIGRNIDEVRQGLADMNFTLNEIFEFNETYNENIIFNTDPQPGAIMESVNGEPIIINVYISRGLETFEMPDLSGLKIDAAFNKISAAGLPQPAVVYDFSDLQPIDKVFTQTPAAGSIVSKTTPVTIYISKGPNPESEVPDLYGKTKEEALSILGIAGFTNISVLAEENENKTGLVFDQEPASGIMYLKSMEIKIKISKGIGVPDVTGMKRQDAVTLLENKGFIVNILPDPSLSGKVLLQEPAALTFAEYGSTVNITVEDTQSTSTSDTATGP